ncbi:MAG: glycosyltransferase [Rhodospirillales bacterium]|jgi:colanic acid biosynthesis glycosyl transferase WcaI|nr:glycosyltransferase [Rhodospirillales bacterium]
MLRHHPTSLVVTQHYWPEALGSGPYCADIANGLAAHGVPVTVFTCRPHYPEGVVAHDYADGGRDRERRGGVRIERVAPWLPRRRNALGRIFAEMVFLLKGAAALARGRIRRTDLVVSLCPSILTVLLGFLATRRGGHHIAIVHDIQSGLASGLGMVGVGPLVNLMRWTERIALNRATVVLVLSHNMRRHLQAQGVKAPIDLLPIWVDTKTITPQDRPEGGAVNVLYSGNFGKKQALPQIVAMAALLEDRGSNVRITLRGAGGEAARLAEEVAARGLGNVHFAPLVPDDALVKGLAEGDIHLVPQNADAADFAVPSKVYTIMAAGRPLVASARRGSMLWQLMDDSRALLCVPAGDASALADAVERLARDPGLRRELGRNGRNYVVTRHDKGIVLQRFLTIALSGLSERIGRGERAASSSHL